jgi:hypothetical protein
VIATLFLAFFTGAGAAAAPVAVAPPAHHHVIQAKPKRRKFTFPNGITVWATSEALARMFAGLDTLEEAPAETLPAVPAPHLEENPPGDEASVGTPPPGEPARGNHGARAAVDYSAAKARLEAEILAAQIRAQAAERDARALLEQARRRRLQDEEMIILQLMMEDA